MDGPIGDNGPIVQYPTALPADSNFPRLLANPALLQTITNVANTLGTTYSSMLDRLFAAYAGCNGVYADCIQAVQSELVNRYHAVASQVDSVASAIGDDLRAYTNTKTTSISLDLDQCHQSIETLLPSLLGDEVLRVSNPRPNKPNNWPISLNWDNWLGFVTSSYGLNRQGQIVFGTRLETDGSITDSVNYNHKPTPDIQGPLNSGAGLGFTILLETDIPNIRVQDNYTCSIGSVGVVIPTPVSNPPVGTVGGQPVIVIPPATTSIPNQPTQVIPQPSNSSCVPCPAPVVHVHVEPTPITVNVPPCPPTQQTQGVLQESVATQGKQAETISNQTEQGGIGQEVEYNDTVKDILESFNMPTGFIQNFGNLVDSELGILVAQVEDVSDIIDLGDE